MTDGLRVSFHSEDRSYRVTDQHILSDDMNELARFGTSDEAIDFIESVRHDRNINGLRTLYRQGLDPDLEQDDNYLNRLGVSLDPPADNTELSETIDTLDSRIVSLSQLVADQEATIQDLMRKVDFLVEINNERAMSPYPTIY